MEKIYRLMIILAAPMFFIGCSTTQQLQLTTVEPAPVVLEKSIQRIGIMNTSLPAGKADFDSRLEQLISYEDFRLVKQGKQAALDALFAELANDKRFDTVIVVKTTPSSLIGLDSVPTAKAWEEIAQLCKENGVDAIFSLTFFEADTQVSSKKTQVESRDILRVKSKEKGHEVTLETLMENGWRIYNPKDREVVDEFVYTNQIVATAKGITPVSALESLETREEDIIASSVQTGSTYGLRLKPYEKTITRVYYSGGTESFKAAHNAVVNNELDTALSHWEKEVGNPKAKLKSRACYNIAVLHEYQNRLEEALSWAKKAKEAHEDELNSSYIEVLQQRQETARAVAIQLAYATIADSPK